MDNTGGLLSLFLRNFATLYPKWQTEEDCTRSPYSHTRSCLFWHRHQKWIECFQMQYYIVLEYASKGKFCPSSLFVLFISTLKAGSSLVFHADRRSLLRPCYRSNSQATSHRVSRVRIELPSKCFPASLSPLDSPKLWSPQACLNTTTPSTMAHSPRPQLTPLRKNWVSSLLTG